MEWLSNFHFLRPLWLLMLIPCLWCCHWLWMRRSAQTGFEQVIDADLLPYLSVGDNNQPTALPYIGLALLWCLGTLALAGPTWKQQPLPLYQSESAVIILLDLSPSMLATDIKPSRIVRARLKIRDLLEQRKDGLTALIVYAGEAYTVTPLSEDTDTIANLLPTLAPGLLPIPGSNIEMAVEMANQLVEDLGIPKAHLVVITDGIDSSARAAIRQHTSNVYSLSILGIGTARGAPIPHENGFLQNNAGEIVMASVDAEQLQTIASENRGIYRPITNTDNDIKHINRFIEGRDQHIQQEQNARYHHFDHWQEFGPYLLLCLLPLAALCFRRGWVLPAILVMTVLPPKPAYGFDWQALWLRKDQQGQQAFQQDDYERAADAFNHLQWRASAYYRNGDFTAAEESFANGNTAVDHYNRGNALAKQGKLAEAIEAYDQALKKAENFEDAVFNRELVEQLLQQKTEEENAQQEAANATNDQQSDQENSQQNSQQETQQNENESANGQRQNTEQSANDSGQQSAEQQSAEQQSKDQAEQNDDQPADSQSIAKENNEAGDEAENEAQKEQDQTPVTFDEQQQSYEQLLRKIPDDPSGLLRRKFNYQYQIRQRQYRRGEWQLPENDAHRRY